MRFSITQMLIAIACIGLVLGAAMRGNYLLGTFAGVVYGLLALTTMFVLIRVIYANPRVHGLRPIFAWVFALGVFIVLAIPDHFTIDRTRLAFERIVAASIVGIV